MNELQVFSYGKSEVVDSREVARMVEKQHPDCIPCLETAAAMIRRDWLHRKEDQ